MATASAGISGRMILIVNPYLIELFYKRLEQVN
jgi:hypothetical protein